MPKPRRIDVIVGSDNDLPQCVVGMELLEQAKRAGDIEMLKVYTMSIHRNTIEILHYLHQRHAHEDVDVIIIAAGWAAHLPGMCDSYLRYQLHNNAIVIVGVALEDKNDSQRTLAAQLSISEVPGTQVVYQDDHKQFVGPGGFLSACKDAITGNLPTIRLPEPKSIHTRTLEEALTFAQSPASS